MNIFSSRLRECIDEVSKFREANKAEGDQYSGFFDSLVGLLNKAEVEQSEKRLDDLLDHIGYLTVDQGPLPNKYSATLLQILDACQRKKKRAGN